MKEIRYVFDESERQDILSALDVIEKTILKIQKEYNIGDDIGYDENIAEIQWSVEQIRRNLE
jgi:hypothetical protein